MLGLLIGGRKEHAEEPEIPEPQTVSLGSASRDARHQAEHQVGSHAVDAVELPAQRPAMLGTPTSSTAVTGPPSKVGAT